MHIPDIPKDIVPGVSSGYFRIKAKIYVPEYGLYAHVQYHRSTGLPDLTEVNGIKELLFTEEKRGAIKMGIAEEAYSLSNLKDIFTEDEAANIVMHDANILLSVSVESVLTQSIGGDMSLLNCTSGYLPKDGELTINDSIKSDKFTRTIRWSKEKIQ